MSMIINIKPEALKELTRRAAALGIQPEDDAAALLEEEIVCGRHGKDAHGGRALTARCRSSRSTRVRFPLLPTEAFTREGLFRGDP
jgi:hypothetical protein